MNDPYLDYLSRRDRRTYTRFVTTYLDAMARFARRIVGSHDLAEDVVQEAFLRLAEVKVEPGGVASPGAYVQRTVLNVARNLARTESVRSRHEEAAARMRPREEAGVDDEAIARESMRRIYDAIDHLGEDLRLAIHLRAVERMSYREIAAVMDVPVETVSSRIHRARREVQ